MTLQAALESWEAQMPAVRDDRALSDVDKVLRARCALVHSLLELGWQAPARARRDLEVDELLLRQPHGVIERGWTHEDPATQFT